MILHPAIVTLLIVSLVISGMIIYCSYFGAMIIRRWNIQSGSEVQLALERRTYLISTLISYMMFFQIVSLFLFVYTADSLHNLFIGAMCAAGSLNVNPYGYPTLLLKIVNFISAGLWLIINYTDNQAYDYPLIKKKYAMLLLLLPLILTESIVQFLYFIYMKADVITSCCGSLFGSGSDRVGSDIAGLPVKGSMAAFYAGFAVTFLLGVIYLVRKKAGRLFSAAAGIFFILSCISLISFISLYFYELPTHHCPFCVLQKEYGYIGYVLYAALLAGVVSGVGVGILEPFGKISSLSHKLPLIQKRLTYLCLFSYLIFVCISGYRMIGTDFTMEIF